MDNYIIVREKVGVVAAHSDLSKIKKWRLKMEKETNENHFIFKEVVVV